MYVVFFSVPEPEGLQGACVGCDVQVMDLLLLDITPDFHVL